MTMDIYQRTIRTEASPPITVDTFNDQSISSTLSQTAMPMLKKNQKPVKRSFDVAFLMAPDDTSKKRQEKLNDMKRAYKYATLPEYESDNTITRNITTNTAASSLENIHYQLNPLRLTVNSDKIRDPSNSPEIEQKENPFLIRSAFTKVTNSSLHLDRISRTPPVAVSPSSVSSTASNHSGLSPDLTYQDSMSPQPFIPAHSPQNQSQPTTNLQYFVANSLLKDIKPEDKCKFVSQDLTTFESENSKKNNRYVIHPPPSLPATNNSKNFAYHAENMAAAAAASIPYSGFPMGPFPFTSTLTPVTGATSVPIFPAAANLTAALLPSSLAALTLPAQNVCAKCNMHFRMTSDLVYHMRSHHKNENTIVDPYKRRRDQDKLKCPVCNESFRERHHLTRHMTAHQDKEDEEAKEFIDITLQKSPISGSAK
ncbi:hypothetical protein PGB90_009463 [Kerria lacca]